MVDYSRIPVSYMEEGLRLWVEKGIRPGSFMTAMLSNDFVNAAIRADDFNASKLPEWARFIYNELPEDCWGSREIMKEWKQSRAN